MPIASHWLTAPRVRRLADALRSLPERPPGLPEADCKLRLWRRCGGPIDDIPILVDVLAHAELITRNHASVRLTPAGRRVTARRRTEGIRPLALALIQAGLLHDQAHRLIDTFPANHNGLTCRLADARRLAPQLLGLLQQWPSVRSDNSTVAIPPDLVAELTAAWALLPPLLSDPDELDSRRKSIGDRAELYSWQFERLLAANPTTIGWVARDDDTLGYDIEDRSTQPRRRIEVKGSGGRRTRFLLSDNEWRKAHEHPSSYEIQFWGGIDLHRPPAEEFQTLRADGYPLVFADVPRLVAAGILDASPDRWHVTGPTP